VRGGASSAILPLSMCRLFGQHAPPEVDRSAALLTSENALRFQSHKHPHGWGIGWYTDGGVTLRRGILPAHADAAFLRAARAARSQVVLAHIRDASVGPVTTVNTHPFRCGRWLFAHNGTVARYRRSRTVRERIEAEIAPFYRRRIRGATDSERCFYLFLSRLAAHDAVDGATLADVRRALAETTRTVSGIADADDAASSLNFLVSDGRLLAACRRGRTLHLATGAGPDRDVVIASEPIGSGAWEEVPEGGFVGTDNGRRVLRRLLLDGRTRREIEPGRARYSRPLTSAPRGKRTS
jgi:predicted glutamine amidotransferase